MIVRHQEEDHLLRTKKIKYRETQKLEILHIQIYTNIRKIIQMILNLTKNWREMEVRKQSLAKNKLYLLMLYQFNVLSGK